MRGIQPSAAAMQVGIMSDALLKIIFTYDTIDH
jgi:hypothetical protein